jgi:hypothetical protein
LIGEHRVQTMATWLSGVVSVLWLLAVAARGGWMPAGDIFLVPVFLILVPAVFAVCIATLWRAIAGWRRNRLSSATLSPLIVVALALLAGAVLPSKPAFVFWIHRDHFIQAAEAGLRTAGETSGHAEYSLPPAPFYESAYVGREPDGPAVIEFTISSSHLLLVYISTDEPTDAHDTCSAGGIAVERIEPRWFACRRDWN